MSSDQTHSSNFFDLNQVELKQWFKDQGLQAFRATQLVKWVYEHNEVNLERMSNLPKQLRTVLTEQMSFNRATVLKHQIATDGTQKLLLKWPADALLIRNSQEPEPLTVLSENKYTTECVMIPSTNDSGTQRYTACVSSQVGCPVGCRFCASGLGGLDANLTAGRIVEQIWHLNQLPHVPRITNVVFMGMGEPLSNLPEVRKAVMTLNADWAFNISARKITISTVGLPAQMRKVADFDLPITLAISLHAPNDLLRKQIIPWAEFVSIKQILDAGRYYFQKTGREITLEYILLGRLNDQAEHAHELAKIAKTLRANINLIRYNEVQGLPYTRPTGDDVHYFQRILRQQNINTHIRASRGRDIAAACGQLRYESKQLG